MTTQTKTIMMLQIAAFLFYWPIMIDLSMKANHPPMSVLVASAAVSLVLGVACITANCYRDGLRQSPAGQSVLNSFVGLCAIISVSVVSLATGTCKVLRVTPEERGRSFYEIGGMLLIYVIFALTLGWCVFRWWLSRQRKV